MPANTNPNADRLLTEFVPPSDEMWRTEAERTLRGKPLERLVTKTYEGISLRPIYRQADVDGVPYLASLPGTAPYVRGSNVVLQPWQISQILPFCTVEAFNHALHHDLARGQTAINLQLDKATRSGRDPDEAVVGDVGVGGVSLTTMDELATALKGIDIERTPLVLGTGTATVPIAAFLFALVRQQGFNPTKLRGGLEMDPLGVLVSDGANPRPVQADYDSMANLLRWSLTGAPNFHIITVHSQPYSDAGASAVQELGFALATGVEYLREMQARGLAVNDVAPRIQFSLSIGSTYFMEIAKLRAARLTWAKVVKAFGGDEQSQKMVIHARTATINKTRYDPWVNILRATVEVFAGAVGGVDSIHAAPFDEPVGLSDEFSRRLARNTQIILQQEAHLTKVMDPAGGSWYVEKLTDEVGRTAWQLLQAVESKGGMYAALQVGFPQEQIIETARRRTDDIARRKGSLVGTNRYPNLEETVPVTRRVDFGALHKTRIEQVAGYRVKANAIVTAKLADLDGTDSGDIIESAIEAALAGATVGQLTRALDKGDGRQETVEPVQIRRLAEPFETLRAFAEIYAQQHGERPKVFLANIGALSKHKTRADFATDFFQVGGFDVVSSDGFNSPESAAQAALNSGAPIVTICGVDEDYPEIVPFLTRQIKSAKPEITVILAGYPEDQITTYQQAGLDGFIHKRTDVVETLSTLQNGLKKEDNDSNA